MKNPVKLLPVLLLSLMISSCAALRVPDMTKIAVGMDKKTVIASLRKNPDNVVGAKKYNSGVIEVLQYIMGINPNGRPQLSWLFFYNDKLMQFGQPDGDWQYTADNIAAMDAK